MRDRSKFRLSHLHKERLEEMEVGGIKVFILRTNHYQGLDYTVIDNVIIRESNKQHTRWVRGSITLTLLQMHTLAVN